MESLIKFFRNNAVLLTCGTVLVAVHWTWYKIQGNPTFVPPATIQKDQIRIGTIHIPNPALEHKKEETSTKQKWKVPIQLAQQWAYKHKFLSLLVMLSGAGIITVWWPHHTPTASDRIKSQLQKLHSDS